MTANCPTGVSRPSAGLTWARGGVTVLIVLATCLTYWPVLDNFFSPIDDPLVLWSAQQGIDPSPHFRPLYPVWNEFLLRLFGLQPFGWYLTGLLAHIAGALLVASLVGEIARSRFQGAVAGLVFGLFYSPHQVVLWISANCGLLAVLCLLLGARCWLVFLASGAKRTFRGALAYSGAMVFLVAAMGFKEDCVFAGPLFLALDLSRNGWHGFTRFRALLKYAIPATLAVIYLSLAFRPSLWADAPGVGEYTVSAEMVPRLFQNFAWLFWPRAAEPTTWTPASMVIGLFLALALATAGFRFSARLPLLLPGLCLALAGMLPALPGPFAIAGTRYSYPASVGTAMILAALARSCWSARRQAVGRTLVVLGLGAWLAVNGLSIRSVENWRYERRGSGLQRMIESTRPLLELRHATLVSPAIYNAHDYQLSLVLWLGVPLRATSMDRVPYGPEFLQRLQAQADLDPALNPVFACNTEGELYRLASMANAPVALWEAQANEYEERGEGRSLFLIHLRGSSSEDQDR